MSGTNNKITVPLPIGVQQEITSIRAYLAEMQQIMELKMKLKAAEDANLVTIEKTDEVIMLEKKLQDKKALVETLQSQLDSLGKQLTQVLQGNDSKLDLLKKELKAKDEEVTTLKEFIGKLPAGNA